MKDKNLKDRLDSLPQPFDKEALWDRIVDKEPRKRKPIFWYWLLPMLLVVGIVVLIWNKEKRLETGAFVKQEESQIEKSEKPSKHVPLIAEKIDQSTQPTVELETEIIHEREEKSKVVEGKVRKKEIAKIFINADSGPTSTIVHTENRPLVNLQPSSPAILFEQENLASKPLLTRDDSSAGLSQSEILREKSTATLLGFQFVQLLGSTRQIETAFANVSSAKLISALPKWDVALYGHYGKEGHSFSSRSSIGTESELEALSLSLQLHRRVGDWVLGAGISHTMGSTLLNHSSSRVKYFEGVASVSKGLETTRYDLYNSYNRTDVFLDLGYVLSIGESFAVIPIIGFGSNVQSSVRGHFFSADGMLQELSTDPDYDQQIGLYRTVGFDFTYYLANKFSLTAGVAVQSKRKYSEEHSIQPVNVRLGIARTW